MGHDDIKNAIGADARLTYDRKWMDTHLGQETRLLFQRSADPCGLDTWLIRGNYKWCSETAPTTSMFELTAWLNERAVRYVYATVDFDCDPDPYGGMSAHSMSICGWKLMDAVEKEAVEFYDENAVRRAVEAARRAAQERRDRQLIDGVRQRSPHLFR